ncbi:MAG: hypothetical protein KDN05_23035, partial [Verrucomicrobiae bacterium]|nr:hypothetical protein [Verrucomicrobiae bacterium]
MTAEQKDILRIAAARMLEAIRYYKKYQPRPGTHGDGNWNLLRSAARLVEYAIDGRPPEWVRRLEDCWNRPDRIVKYR